MGLASPDKLGRVRESGNHISRYIKSFKHALDGIGYVLKHEHNVIIIIIAIIVTTILGFIYKITSYEWLFIITSFGLVSACEMLNTSIEATIDLKTNKFEPLAKLAKDTASSATLIFCIMAFIGALIIFIPKIVGV